MTILEHLERRAKENMKASITFTSCDVVAVEYHKDWVEGTQFQYFHNRVLIDRQKAQELIPGYVEG